MAQSTMFEKLNELPAEERKGVWVWLRKQITFLLILAALLFGTSGRLDWTWGWIQFGLYGLSVATMAVTLMATHPALLAERAQVQPGTKKWDVPLTSLAVIVFPIAAWVVAALDVRHGWEPDFSSTVQIISVIVWLLGYGLTVWAMMTNAYFSATVRIQSERDHQVVTGGPYGIVRHPGYLGAIIYQIATSTMLGSPWSLIPSLVAVLLLMVRTGLEDRTLRRELPGYEAFTRETRYRLIPGVW